MSDQPNTISDKDWATLQRGAADKVGGLIKTDEQKQAADTWTKQRDRKKWS
jgi:hypothetical protein